MRLHLLVLRDGCGAGECVFLDHPLTQRLRSSRRVRLRPGVSLRRPLEEFTVLGVLVLCARGNLVHYFSTTLYLAVYSSVSRCRMWSTERWILREMTVLSSSGINYSRILRAAWFDSGYGVCFSTWLLDEFHTISASTKTRILRYFCPFSRRMEKCVQPTLQLAVPWCAARTWNSGNSSHGILVADTCDDGEVGVGLSSQSGPDLLGRLRW